ncbi:MAG: sugar transferase, partial [Stomatobaculum sp.]|nr:sugar transferase [Stomatobaculum sp.]
MIQRNQSALNFLSAAADFFLVLLSYLFSAWFRLKVLNGWWENQGLSTPMILASVFYAAGLLFMLSLLGFYNSTRVRKLSWKLSTLYIGTTLSIFIVTAFIFAFKVEDVSRGIIVLFYVLTLLLLGGKQVLTRLVLNQVRSGGYNIKHQLLVGTGRLSKQYREDLGSEPELGIEIDKTVEAEEDLESFLAPGMDSIDEVVLALEPEEYAHITRHIAACEKNGVRYFVIPFYNDMIPEHPVFENIGRTRLINMRANRLQQLGWAAVKRAFDILVSALGLIVLSPLLLFLALGVKLSSPGPVFFKQERVGYNRNSFYMLKFRSMVVNDKSDTAWNTSGDSRRTKFG